MRLSQSAYFEKPPHPPAPQPKRPPMLRDHFGRPVSVFKTLRQLHGHNLDASGLNDLTEAFGSFMTRARYFSFSLRRTWSYSALEFMKYRRRLPALLDPDENQDGPEGLSLLSPGRSSTDRGPGSERLASRERPLRASLRGQDPRRVFVQGIPARVTSRQLASFFTKFGRVMTCSLPSDKGGTLGRRKQSFMGYVTFASREEAARALAAPPDELTYYGQEMTVSQDGPSLQETGLSPVRGPPPGTSGGTPQGTPGGHPKGAARRARIDRMEFQRMTSSPSRPSPQGSTGSGNSPTGLSLGELPEKAISRIFENLPLLERIRLEVLSKRCMEIAYDSYQNVKGFKAGEIFGPKSKRHLKTTTLKSILHRIGRHLENLDLTNAGQFLDEKAIIYIAAYCPKLKSINLTGIARLDWPSLKELSEGCPHLEEVTILADRTLSDKALWWLFRNCREIKSVNFAGCRKIVGRCFRHLGLTLESANLANCPRIDPLAIESLSKQCLNLTSLVLDGHTSITDNSLIQICRLDNLEMLSLKGTRFKSLTSEGLFHVGKLSSLKELYLDHNPLVTGKLLQEISAGCKELANLSISGAGGKIDSESLESLAKCQGMKELNLSYQQMVTDAVLAKLLGAMEGLQVLILRGCASLTSSGVGALAPLAPSLWELDVSGCLKVGNPGIQPFLEQLDGQGGSSLTIALGGTACMPKLLATKGTRVVVDVTDYAKRTVKVENILAQEESDLEDSDLDIAKNAMEEEYYLRLSEQPSFILNNIEEDSLSEEEGPSEAIDDIPVD